MNELMEELSNFSVVNDCKYCAKIKLPFLRTGISVVTDNNLSISEMILTSSKGYLYLGLPDQYVITETDDSMFISDEGVAFLANQLDVELSKFDTLDIEVINVKNLHKEVTQKKSELKKLEEELKRCRKAPDFE